MSHTTRCCFCCCCNIVDALEKRSGWEILENLNFDETYPLLKVARTGENWRELARTGENWRELARTGKLGRTDS